MSKLVITKEDVAKTLEARKKLLPNYVDDEEMLDCLFSKHPQNINFQEVHEKVCKLNSSYSTRLKDKETIAKHIMEVEKIDARIGKGDPTVVHEIAQNIIGNGRSINHFVFATKYCSFHRPDKYPIIDSLVCKAFESLRNVLDCGPYCEDYFKDKLWNGEKDCGYLRYKNVYDRFIELFGDAFPSKDYRTIDHYIWTSRKIASMNQENKLAEKYPELYSLVKSNAINSFMKETH